MLHKCTNWKNSVAFLVKNWFIFLRYVHTSNIRKMKWSDNEWTESLDSRKNGILFQKLFWSTVKKIVIVIKKTFWGLRGWRPRISNFDIFTTMAAINKPEKKLANHTSVQFCKADNSRKEITVLIYTLTVNTIHTWKTMVIHNVSSTSGFHWIGKPGHFQFQV